MNIQAFDTGLEHRKILPYDTAYPAIFLLIQQHFRSKRADVELVHIGSTAIPDLRGKPMLDAAAITPRQDLRHEQREFEQLGFQRRPVWVDRDDKPYVCGSVQYQDRRFNINIHICHRDDPVHRDSLRFMRILTMRPDLRRRYEDAKDHAHAIDPVNPEAYNRAKEAVIRAILEQGSEGLA